MRLRRILASLGVAVLAASAGVVLGSTPALAHHPEITTTSARPCGDTAPWSLTYTAKADADRNKNWRNRNQNSFSQTSWTSWGPGSTIRPITGRSRSPISRPRSPR